jgi:hypothetical protein
MATTSGYLNSDSSLNSSIGFKRRNHESEPVDSRDCGWQAHLQVKKKIYPLRHHFCLRRAG